MKKTLLFLMLLVSTISIAQDFILLGEDPEGDPTINGIADLRAVSYAIDESMDSLWFKIELHTALPGDLGVVFGIDTDLIPDNGLNWNSSNNMGLLPEVVFTVNRNFIDPSFLYGFSNNDLNQTSTFGDNDSTIIVNMQLSKLDMDGQFNLILGSSSFDADTNNRTIFDDLPDTGFFTIDNTTPVLEIAESSSYEIYPNPVSDYVYIENIDQQAIDRAQIYNSSGQLIKEFPNNSDALIQKINCEDLQSGIYFLSIWNTDGFNTAKFLKL